jgi:rubrerythrin
MENETKIGMNRTGMQMSPIEGPDQADFAMAMVQPASAEIAAETIDEVRASYIRESLRVGSVPLPRTGKGLLSTAMDKMTGKSPEVLIDKLGQRLAFERSGVRLYEALITKVETMGHTRRDELCMDLRRIRQEEFEHFQMLTSVIQDIGADPTAQTPCADISGVASLGLLQVITDPRTTVAQSLEAILTAELTDNACWELLIELATEVGHEKMAAPFRDALLAEQQHLVTIKQWLRETVLTEAA